MLPETEKFKKGEVIYSSDNFSPAVGLVLKGAAVAVTDNANAVVMKRFSAGMCFGAAAVFGNGDTYVSRIIAKKDTEIKLLNEELLTEIFALYPKTAINYIAFLSDKIRFLNGKLSVISCQNSEDTVYKYLISVTDTENYAQLPKSMTELSRMLGIGRATLYRCLDALEESGKILRENSKVKVIKNEKTN